MDDQATARSMYEERLLISRLLGDVCSGDAGSAQSLDQIIAIAAAEESADS